MDSSDDDFGDLYVEVEAQVTSAVSGDADSGSSLGESECGTDLDTIRSSEMTIKTGSVAEAKKLVLVTQELSRMVDEGGGVTPNEERNDSEDNDSDDDLKIVLTDGEDEKGGCNNAAADGVKASFNDSVRRPERIKWCGGMKKHASDNNGCINQARGMPQWGYSFSLPWCRTMFGVCIDSFEEKSWRNPGADITDFFNFGFNERTWEDYCKPLRHHYAFINEHVEAVDHYVEDKIQFETPTTSRGGELRPFVQLKGRAIEVEDRSLERIPSVDLRRPRDPDPDVVIQIPVDNSVGESLGSTIKRPSRDEEPGASGNEDHNKRMHSSVDSTEGQSSAGFQRGNTRILSGEQSPFREKCCSPVGVLCAEEVTGEEEKEVCGSSDESDYAVERGSSPPDQIHFSPTPSYSDGKSEESKDSEAESLKDSTTDAQIEVYIPPRRTRLSECERSEYKVHERNNVDAGERNGTKHLSCRRSHDVGERTRTNRVRSRRSHERQRHCGRPDSDSDSGKEILTRNKNHFCYSSKYRNIGHLSNSERDTKDGKGCALSDRGRHYSSMYASMDHGRHRKRQHKFGNQRNEQPLHARGIKHSDGHNYEREFGDFAVQSSFNYWRRTPLRSFKKEEDPYRHHYERGCFHERSGFLKDENNRDRNLYDSRTEPFYVEKVPITDRDHRLSLEHTSDSRRHNHQQGQENDLHYRNMYDYANNLYSYRYEDEDDVHREQYGVALELAFYDKDSFSDLGRREYPEYGRDGEFSGRGEVYTYAPDWRLDGVASEKVGYNYRMPSSCLSLREFRYAKGARSYLWRDDIRGYKTSEEYDSRKNQLYNARERDGWMGKLQDSVDTEGRINIHNYWIGSDKKKYKLKNDFRGCTRDVTHEHLLNTDEMSVGCRRTSTCDQMHTKQRTSHENKHSYGRETELHMIEDHDQFASSRIKHEHSSLKFQDAVDITIGKGKYSKQSWKRCSNGRDKRESQNRGKRRKEGVRSSEKPVQRQDSNIKEEGEIIEEAKGTEIDEEQIRESLKKMEKRRERFKELEAAKRVATCELQAAELIAQTYETKQQQRPPRKRRWC